MSRIPGTEIDLLNVPPDSPPELAAHLKSIWLNETGRECLVLSGATYCGTVRADVVSAEVIDGFTAHDMAQAREEGYSAGVQLAVEYEAILTDLIAELREDHRPTPSGHLCEDCQEDHLWPCPAAQAADRAEARLKGLTDE